MEQKEIERRLCVRFEIPGATVSYRKTGFLSSKTEFDEEFCPVLDLSRGGLRFLCQNELKINGKIELQVSVPGEKIPLAQKGIIRWSSFAAGQSYKHQIGVQFNAYGEKKDQNYPGNLVKIIALEQKFAPKEEEATKKTEEFDIEG